MPSMVPMMSLMRRELDSICCMTATTSPTTSPPLEADTRVALTRSLACCAELAVLATVPVSSSIEEAVSCRLEAVASVRADRSSLPVAISRVATLIVSVPSRTWRTMRRNESCIALSSRSSTPISSLRSTTMSWLRSPLAMVCATAPARTIGARTECVMRHAMKMPSTTASAVSDSISVAACAACSRCCAAKASVSSEISDTSFSTDAR